MEVGSGGGKDRGGAPAQEGRTGRPDHPGKTPGEGRNKPEGGSHPQEATRVPRNVDSRRTQLPHNGGRTILGEKRAHKRLTRELRAEQLRTRQHANRPDPLSLLSSRHDPRTSERIAGTKYDTV